MSARWAAVAGSSDTGNGGFGGGTVGYNWQFPGSQFVFGVEVDAAGASIKDSVTEDIGGGILAHDGIKINSFGSVTGRAGFAMGCGPDLRQGRLCVGQQQGHHFSASARRDVFG